MSKSVYHYISKAWSRPYDGETKKLNRERLIEWRHGPTFQRVERPLRLDRARILGYKAKQGYVIVRAKVRTGSLRKRAIRKGRRAKRRGMIRIRVQKNIQRIAEERTAKRYTNLEVLNSYYIGEDGKHRFYEIILVDPHHPVIVNDPKINWIHERQHTRRVYRGLTSSGKKSRGLRKKGIGSEKSRPSVSANKHKKRPGKKIRFS
ncbi:MAG: 50S ribosomal protein L15e [Candidatus Thermoplasmatota archaeon]|nr:50S ribosomal protein L15e [Candidatus Thermoplasmatota archaeon]